MLGVHYHLGFFKAVYVKFVTLWLLGCHPAVVKFTSQHDVWIMFGETPAL